MNGRNSQMAREQVASERQNGVGDLWVIIPLTDSKLRFPSKFNVGMAVWDVGG